MLASRSTVRGGTKSTLSLRGKGVYFSPRPDFNVSVNRLSALFLVAITAVLMFFVGSAHGSWQAERLDATQATLLIGFIGAGITSIAVVVALWAILSQHRTAKAQATIAHLAANGRDRDILDAKQKFLELAADPQGMGKWASAKHDSSPEARAIRLYLNSFELISLGIQSRIIDYKIYRRWNRSTVLATWAASAPYVSELRKRTGRAMLFHEFEELARDFDDLKRPKRRFGP